MTTNQIKLTDQTLAELKQLAPSVSWHVSYNYYTKLPQFTAIKDGGIHYSMHKREWKGSGAELEATYDNTSRIENTLIVSGAHNWDKLPKPNIHKDIDRVNYNHYLQFIKDNLGLLESIGA